MPADYRSTLGFLALRERAANQERQRAEIAQKLLQDRSGMADSVRHTTNLMELAVRAAGQKQRGDLAVAKLLAESEGAMGRPRTQFVDAPVEDMSEAGYAAGEASRLPPPMRPVDPELLAIRQAELDARNQATKIASKRTQVEEDKANKQWQIALLRDRRAEYGQRIDVTKANQAGLADLAAAIQKKAEFIERAESNLMGAGYDPNSPEALELQTTINELGKMQQAYEKLLETLAPRVKRKTLPTKAVVPGVREKSNTSVDLEKVKRLTEDEEEAAEGLQE